ncbi:MAG: hypothetical protein V7K88_01380 [Nostoc sp.]|uniref:hypothetical protein n=2 Tax=Nostoc sp. TaxID=1180 RepID=UPI002FFC1ABB
MIDIKAGGKNLMNLSVTTSSTKTVPKLTYDVLIENEQDGRVSATVLGFPDIKSSSATKEEALEKLIQLLEERKPEIVTLEIEPPQTEATLEFLKNVRSLGFDQYAIILDSSKNPH